MKGQAMNTSAALARINETTLTDGSKVYDVDLLNDMQEVITRIPCLDQLRAYGLLNSLRTSSNICAIFA